MERAFVVHQMVPVADHSEVADLGIDPAALVEGVFAAAQAGDEGSAVQLQLLGGGDAGQLEEGGVKVGEVDEVPRDNAALGQERCPDDEGHVDAPVRLAALAFRVRLFVEDPG